MHRTTMFLLFGVARATLRSEMPTLEAGEIVRLRQAEKNLDELRRQQRILIGRIAHANPGDVILDLERHVLNAQVRVAEDDLEVAMRALRVANCQRHRRATEAPRATR